MIAASGTVAEGADGWRIQMRMVFYHCKFCDGHHSLLFFISHALQTFSHTYLILAATTKIKGRLNINAIMNIASRKHIFKKDIFKNFFKNKSKFV